MIVQMWCFVHAPIDTCTTMHVKWWQIVNLLEIATDCKFYSMPPCPAYTNRSQVMGFWEHILEAAGTCRKLPVPQPEGFFFISSFTKPSCSRALELWTSSLLCSSLPETAEGGPGIDMTSQEGSRRGSEHRAAARARLEAEWGWRKARGLFRGQNASLLC